MESRKRTKTAIASIMAVFWVAVAIVVCYGATRLGLGSVTEPGPGFIFFWSGLLLAALSLIVATESLRGSAEPQEMGRMNWVKIGLVLLSLVLYAFFLERVGFMLTTFVVLSFLLGLIEGTNSGRSFAVAAAAALGSFGIFELWLKIRLPKGIFGL